MAFTKTEDEFGRQVHIWVGNESEDGTGDWHVIKTDTSGRVLLGATTNVIGKVGHDSTGFGHGVETCDSAGTDQPIVTSSTPAKRVKVQAQTDNTDGVAVGGSGVDAVVATGTGILLYAGDWSDWINVDDLDEVYFDALVTGEGVRFIYET